MKTIRDFFTIQELVCKHVYQRFGNAAWMFYDPRLLANVLFIRLNLGLAITANNWHRGGFFSQRGIRCNICDIVKAKTLEGILYMSAHERGQALDFDVMNMSAEQVRMWIYNNADRMPYPCRLESDVAWVHMDVCTDEENGKVIFFKA